MIVAKNEGFITRRRIKTRYEQIAICTRDCDIKLIATYGNQTIIKRLDLSNYSCKNIDIDFYFPLPISQVFYQTILLLDANYSLPVNIAVLNFRQ